MLLVISRMNKVDVLFIPSILIFAQSDFIVCINYIDSDIIHRTLFITRIHIAFCYLLFFNSHGKTMPCIFCYFYLANDVLEKLFLVVCFLDDFCTAHVCYIICTFLIEYRMFSSRHLHRTSCIQGFRHGNAILLSYRSAECCFVHTSFFFLH